MIIQRPQRVLDYQDRALLASISEWLRTPSGTMTLRDLQAMGLLEIALYGGLFAAARVGAGKTLMAGLAPTVLRAKRPLMFCPANVVGDTTEHLKALRLHWRIPHVPIKSYHKLSSKKHPEYLWDYAPDVLIFDEVHKLKRVKIAACARRVARFLREFPHVKVVALSGTPVRQSLLDYAHILLWVLKERAPVPANPDLLQEWARLLDNEDEHSFGAGGQGVWGREDYSIMEPLLGGPIRSKEEARAKLAEALSTTPGIVISTKGYQGVGLTIRPIHLPPPKALDQAWDDLRNTWTMPDGWDLADTSEQFGVAASAKQFQDGFYYYHDPRPPRDWMLARREWCSFCRRVLEDSYEYDSETQVRDACLAGLLPDDAWRAWEEIKDEFVPRTKPLWISTHALIAAEKWGRQEGSNIVWTSHTAFAEELAERTGWPYYGKKGVDAKTGGHIRGATAPTIIASSHSNTEGRNLQIDCGPGGRGYYRNLFMHPPKSSLDWEQRCGRTHRDLQTRDVLVEYFVGCLENWRALPSALEYARLTKGTWTMEPKLLQEGVEISLPLEVWLQGPAFETSQKPSKKEPL